MVKQKSNTEASINVGSSSLLMIFVVLCLVSFATLSIVSANADRKLSKKVLEHTQAYYDACNEAEHKLLTIDQSLSDIYSASSSESEFFEKAGQNIQFAIPVTELHTLKVVLELQYPQAPEEGYYKIVCYELETTGSLELDESLPVLKE